MIFGNSFHRQAQKRVNADALDSGEFVAVRND
jgi:hypothetical protein